MLRFDGRAAIVTGAGTGLGREHALLLASRGASVVVNDPGSTPEGASTAEAVVREIQAAGGTAVAHTGSIATPDGGAGAVEACVDSFGRVDIVVNNAGIVRDRTFAKLTPDLIDPVLDVHLKGAFYVSRPAFARMKTAGYGRIVMTTSAAGLFGNFGQTNYGAAKMGLVGLARVLNLEGARYNIRTNAIAPIAATAMSAGILDEDWERRLKPALVAPIVAVLAHESCQVSGQIFSSAAGRVARIFIGESRGYYSPTLTPEEILDNWDTVCSEAGYATPMSAEDERELLIAAFTRHETTATTSPLG
jgi:NAD(P)-dependent dehydrogenase (short-subunit alcohol dehydrogenase family)